MPQLKLELKQHEQIRIRLDWPILARVAARLLTGEHLPPRELRVVCEALREEVGDLTIKPSRRRNVIVFEGELVYGIGRERQ